MSRQYQPTAYYDWPARTHGDHLNLGGYESVSYDYYQGDEIYTQTTAFKHNGQISFDGTQIRVLNNTKLSLYDTSGIQIADSGTLAMHTSAGRTFSIDPHGRVGIGMDHGNTIDSDINTPDFDLNVRGTVGVENFIYHNDDVDTYMLFGSDTTYHPLNTSGNVLSASGDLDEINFRVGGVDLLQLVEDDTQDAVVINKSLSDVDLVVRSATCSGAIVSRGDGTEVVINEDGVDTDFRVESTASDGTYPDPGDEHLAHDKEHALFVDGTNGRVGLGTSNPNTTLHVAGSAHIEGDLWIKGVTNQIDTMVHVTSAMDITNKGTGPALEVKQTGAQPVAVFYDDDLPALYIEDKGNIGIGLADPASPLHITDNEDNYSGASLYATLRIDHNHDHGGIVINSTDNKQSHLRFANNGDTRWQIRHPLHDTNGEHDTLRFYSYTDDSDVMTLSPSGTVGIGITFPVVSLNVDSTDALRVPVGNVAQRPAQTAFGIAAADTLGDGTGNTTNAASMLGMIRYNTENSTFEGFGPGYTWGSLGGVIDVDRDTYWTAVNDLNNVHDDEFDTPNAYNTYPGDTDYLRAFTSGLKRFAIASDGDVNFYRKTSGNGTSSNYTYNTYLKISPTNANDATITAGSGGITFSAAGAHQVNISNHNGSNGGLALAGTLVTATAAELNIMDGCISTTTELNVMDGGTTAATTAVDADDAFVRNNDGTMDQVAAATLRTYCQAGLTASKAVITSSDGALTTGTVTSTELTVLNTATAGTMVASKAAIYSAGGALVSTSVIASSAVEIGTMGALPSSSPIEGTTFVLRAAGNIRADGDVIAFATSDESLKDNKTPIADSLAKISTLTGYEFDWNDDAEFSGHDVGVIAQEVEKVLPEVVTTRESGVKAVKYEKLVPLLIEGIKAQNEKISSLEAKVEQLLKSIGTE